MAISKDLFLAILAMDSYNRGYGAGIKSPNAGPREGLTGTQIGHATLSTRADGTDEEAASFFAQAYTIDPGKSYSNPAGDSLTAGQTVISYRRTDEPFAFLPPPCGEGGPSEAEDRVGVGQPAGSRHARPWGGYPRLPCAT